MIALAVALASIPTDGTSWNRFLGFSRQFDPFINFGSAFVTVLPLLLGYYHWARLGALVGLAVSAAMFWATQLSAFFVFAFQLVGSSFGVARGCICGRLATAYDDGSMGTLEGKQFPCNPECTAIAARDAAPAQIRQLTRSGDQQHNPQPNPATWILTIGLVAGRQNRFRDRPDSTRRECGSSSESTRKSRVHIFQTTVVLGRQSAVASRILPCSYEM